MVHLFSYALLCAEDYLGQSARLHKQLVVRTEFGNWCCVCSTQERHPRACLYLQHGERESQITRL